MSHDVLNITGVGESCQNEISALATHVNGIDFALGQKDDLHDPLPHANLSLHLQQNQPQLHSLFMEKSCIHLTFISF